jgi:hypothetical protein
MPFMASAALCLDDNQPVTRLALSQSLFLPSPPPLDMLRPPRA